MSFFTDIFFGFLFLNMECPKEDFVFFVLFICNYPELSSNLIKILVL